MKSFALNEKIWFSEEIDGMFLDSHTLLYETANINKRLSIEIKQKTNPGGSVYKSALVLDTHRIPTR